MLPEQVRSCEDCVDDGDNGCVSREGGGEKKKRANQGKLNDILCLVLVASFPMNGDFYVSQAIVGSRLDDRFDGKSSLPVNDNCSGRKEHQ